MEVNKQRKKKASGSKRIVRGILWGVIAVALVAMLAALWNIYSTLHTYSVGEKNTKELLQYFSTPQAMNPITVKPKAEQAEKEAEEENPYQDVVFPEVDFASLAEINSDLVGWIYVPDTHVNYPIAQAEDNVYYLERMFNRHINDSGCIYLDARDARDLSSLNSIIYGHNMKDESMFHDLLKYKKQKFYDEHPCYLLMTPEKKYVVEIFAIYPLSVYENGWQVDFESEEEYGAFLAACKERSIIDTIPTPTTEDRIITLSTCTYEFQYARLLINGILREVK